MIINNGIFNQGDNNCNIINKDFNFFKIKEELNVLSNYTEDNLNEVISASDKKDKSKFIIAIKKLGKSTLDLISKLGLYTLEKIIEKYIQ